MASSSHSHHHDPHDWASAEYVARWANGQDPKEANRRLAFDLIADTIPHEKTQAITFLDLAAGYGAPTKFLLERFPNATAACQDRSAELATLGRERMTEYEGRFPYVIADLSRQ